MVSLVHVSGVIGPCDGTNLAAPTPVLKIETLCIGDNRLFSQSFDAKQMERCILLKLWDYFARSLIQMAPLLVIGL